MRKILTVCCCLLALGANAQPGISEMQQAQQQLTSSFFSALDFALVLAGIFGIIGGLRIYHNWQMGHPRIDQQVAAWFFAALFMVLAGAFLQAVFGI
jgi:succinate dehydrogenase/fumarate reductase cytochrome b subunit